MGEPQAWIKRWASSLVQWAAPFKVGLGFLFVQCAPAFEAVFRGSSCLKRRTWTKKELSCAVFIGSQLLRQCAGEVPTVGKRILLHWCTTLYSTLLPGCISQCCWKLTQVSHNFCGRLFPEGSTLTTFTTPESFSLAFTSIPPCVILLHPSIPPDSISMLTPVYLSFLSQGSALENSICNFAMFSLCSNLTANVGQDDL